MLDVGTAAEQFPPPRASDSRAGSRLGLRREVANDLVEMYLEPEQIEV
jgi:hypothetical protein